jgi:DNA-binding transcriptional ArsR family regulator
VNTPRLAAIAITVTQMTAIQKCQFGAPTSIGHSQNGKWIVPRGSLKHLKTTQTEARPMLSEKALEAAVESVCEAMRENRVSRLHHDAVRAVLKALEAEGLVIVPSEPTEVMKYYGARNMFKSGHSPSRRDKEIIASIYRVMLSAHDDGK